MKALVTGGAGFIGSHIVDALIEKGHKICVVDNLWDQGGGNIMNVHSDAAFYHLDILSPSLIDVFEIQHPDVVYHEAAQHSVKISTDNPELDAKVNVLGLINILQCCVKTGVKKIVLASTGATHGIVDKSPINEETPQRPLCPYGITKMAEEHYLRVWHERHGLKYTVFRYANIYGPRQDATGEAGVIAIFAQQVINNETVTIMWDGEQSRDFVYVGDVARANALVISTGDNDVYCLGTGIGTSVNEIYQKLSGITGNNPGIISAPKTQGDQRHSVFDSSKIERERNWIPRVAIDDGLRKTVEFFKERV